MSRKTMSGCLSMFVVATFMGLAGCEEAAPPPSPQKGSMPTSTGPPLKVDPDAKLSPNQKATRPGPSMKLISPPK